MPTVSKWKPEFVEIAKELCKNGASDRDLARHLGISHGTLYTYANKYPEFAEALKMGKGVADDRVERTLYQRALGYDVEEEKSFLDRKTGKIITAIEKKHIPPEPKCLTFWLANRRPEAWAEVSKHELTGANGGAIQTSDVSMIDVARRIAFTMRMGASLGEKSPVLLEQSACPSDPGSEAKET